MRTSTRYLIHVCMLFLALTPAVARSQAPDQGPLADLVWQWGDVNLGPGIKGIRVMDWDGDGHSEVLVAHNSLVIAVQHQGDYQFSQEWAGPMGVSWGWDHLVGDAAPELWVIDAGGEIVGYLPHSYTPAVVRQLILSGSPEVVGALTTDLQGDGGRELLVMVCIAGVWQFRAYALPSLNQTWTYTLPAADGGAIFVTGQVDDDPAAEIILSTGSVIDPVLGAEQWSYNDGFGLQPAAADVDDDGRDEVLAMNDWYYITAFDVELQSPRWQINTGTDHDSLLLADVAGDGTPEVIVGEGQWGSVLVYDAETQSLLWNVNNPEHGVCGLGVGDADDDGELDLIWGAGYSSTGEDHLYLAPISQHSYAFAFPDYDGPYHTAALQMDADQPLELVVFSDTTNSYYGLADYFIVDSASGAEEPGLGLQIDAMGYDERPAPLVANVDDDPYEELILGVGNDLYVLDQDGTRLNRTDAGLELTPTWVGDVDGDAQIELVSTSANQVHVHLLDTLEYEWQSIGFPAGVQDLAVADVDQDGHREIVFHGTGSYLQAYDGQTHLLDWQFPSTQHAYALDIGNADSAGPLEIAVVEDGYLTFYNALTRTLIRRTFQIDTYFSDLTFTHMTMSPYPQLVVVDQDAVMLLSSAYATAPAQTVYADRPRITLADTEGDHHLDILVGQQIGVARYRMRETFLDVVPPLAWPVLPRPGTDLVGRDVSAQALFGEEMDPGTITAANAQMLIDGAPHPVTLTYDPTDRSLVLSPQSLLPPASTVTVWLGPGLTDLAGNGLDGNLNGVGGEPGDQVAWQFTTGEGVDETGPAINNLSLEPNPLWAGMPVALDADVDDTHPSAASTVSAVEYFVGDLGDPGTGTPVDAIDGAFDERQEQATATLDSTGWFGARRVHVRAQDSVGNWGEPVVATLTLYPELRDNWPTFGQNAAHTGYNARQLDADQYEFAWERNMFLRFGTTNGRPLAQVASANGVVVGSVSARFGNGGVIAFDVTDGTELWRRTFTDKYSVNPPSVAYGTVYFQQGNHGSDTYLFALNVLTGQEMWRAPFSTQWEEYFAPTVANGRVFINGGYYGGMYAFDAFDGSQLWFKGLAQYDKWTPAYRDDVVYTWVDGGFAAWDPSHGTLLWSLDLGGYWDGGGRIAAISTDTAYVTARSAAGTDDLVAIDLINRQEKWRVPGDFAGSPAVAGGEVYGLNGAVLRVSDASSGQKLWSYNCGESLIGAPVVTMGQVYVASANQTWILDRDTHELVWHVDKGGWLTVANDRLFIAQPNGKLAAYQTGRDHTYLPLVSRQK